MRRFFWLTGPFLKNFSIGAKAEPDVLLCITKIFSLDKTDKAAGQNISSAADVLSPEFVEVLEPGDDYVGGLEFFGGNRHLRVSSPMKKYRPRTTVLLNRRKPCLKLCGYSS